MGQMGEPGWYRSPLWRMPDRVPRTPMEGSPSGAGYARGLTPKQLNEPIYRIVQNRKIPDWKIEGDWNFNLDAIAQFIQTLVKLNNSSYSIT